MPLTLWTTLRRVLKETNSGSDEGKIAAALSGISDCEIQALQMGGFVTSRKAIVYFLTGYERIAGAGEWLTERGSPRSDDGTPLSDGSRNFAKARTLLSYA